MEVESLLAWLIIGAIAGWLAGLVVQGTGFRLIGYIIVGIVGAFIAGWLLPQACSNCRLKSKYLFARQTNRPVQ